MRFLLALLILNISIVGRSAAQVPDSVVERLMTERIFDCDIVTLNATTMIPILSQAHHSDTIYAITRFMEKYCGVSEPIVSFLILDAIKNHTFQEQIKKGSLSDEFDYYRSNIISYLHWYRLGHNIQRDPAAYTPDSADGGDALAIYADYYTFLQSLARSLCDKPGLTQVENYLVHFYASPDSADLADLKRSLYDSTVLQSAYNAHEKMRNTVSGFQIAFIGGSWMPDGHLGAVGSHPYLGFTMGKRYNRFMWAINANIRFNNTPGNYLIAYGDTVYQNKNYYGLYVGIDAAYQLLKVQNHELDLLFGIGLDDFGSAVNDGNNDTVRFASFNYNLGLGYKKIIRHVRKEYVDRFSYVAIQVKYNFLNFSNPGATDLAGNAFTFGLLYGLYRRPVRYYYNIP